MSGYLLKPLKDTELSELLLKIKADLELIELMELSKINSSLNLNKTILNRISQEAVLRRLLDGDLIIEDFEASRYLEGQEWHFLTEPIRIALCNIEFGEPSTASLLRKLAINTGLLCLKKMNIQAIEHSGFIVIFLGDDGKIQRKKIFRLLDNYRCSFKIELEKLCMAEYNITIGVSNVYCTRNNSADAGIAVSGAGTVANANTIYSINTKTGSVTADDNVAVAGNVSAAGDVSAAGSNTITRDKTVTRSNTTTVTVLNKVFNEALCSYKHKYFLGTDKIIFYEDLNVKDYSALGGSECSKIVEKITNIIFIGEENKLLVEIDNLFFYIDEQGDFTVEDINAKIIEVFFNISHTVKVAGISDSFSVDRDIINEIQQLTSYNCLKKWFKDKIINLYRMARLYSYDDSSWMVQKAIYYVKANISKKIALEDIAEYLYVNASYFSSTFKKNTGQNFIDYVTELKIQEAKYLLLNSTLKIKEISGKVGYNDYSYFCKVFKAMENITPLEFRMKGFIK